MRNYTAFLKKELMEYMRTYKIFVAVIVFFLLGMMNPLTAKFTPELIEMFAEELASVIPAPVKLDAWVQFFSNMSSMGFIVLVILFSGMLSGEINRGSLVLLLTKGLSRVTVILAKVTIAFLVWTLSYLLCFGVSYGYTEYLFGTEQFGNLGFAICSMWLFGGLLIMLVTLGSVLFVHGYGSLLFTGAVVCVLLLLNIPPAVQKYNPMQLTASNMALLSGDMPVSDFHGPVIVTVLLILACGILAVALFYKKKI